MFISGSSGGSLAVSAGVTGTREKSSAGEEGTRQGLEVRSRGGGRQQGRRSVQRGHCTALGELPGAVARLMLGFSGQMLGLRWADAGGSVGRC